MRILAAIIGISLFSGCATRIYFPICGSPSSAQTQGVTVTVVKADEHVDMDPVVQPSAYIIVRYPYAMSRAGINGTVRAQLHISESGRVTDCTIISYSHREFRDAVLSSFEAVRFFSAKTGGQPVPSVVVCDFSFVIEEE